MREVLTPKVFATVFLKVPGSARSTTSPSGPVARETLTLLITGGDSPGHWASIKSKVRFGSLQSR